MVFVLVTGAYLVGMVVFGTVLARREVHDSDAYVVAGRRLLEPGIYVPGLGGFRHSDTVVLTAQGGELITEFPRDLESLTLPGYGQALVQDTPVCPVGYERPGRASLCYPALLPPLPFARRNAPDAEAVFGEVTVAPDKISSRSPMRRTMKEKPRLRSCSTRPSRRNAPRWCSRLPYLS